MIEPFTKKQYYLNQKVDKKVLGQLTSDFLTQFGLGYAINLIESLKNLGFRYATNAGISLGVEDLKIPFDKGFLLEQADQEIEEATLDWQCGKLTDIERFQKIIDTWDLTSETLKNRIVEFFQTTDPLNNIHMIAFSGARANLSQVRQLIGMRGLMANQKGEIIDLPIIKNFREGLNSVDYIISSYGARKGIVDTALRTADSGYLTRRLVEIGQDVIIREIDCNTLRGVSIDLSNYKNSMNALRGRSLCENIFYKNKILFKRNDILHDAQIQQLEQYSISRVVIRSPLNCEAYHSICQFCYGWNLAYQELVDLGEAIGVIAGQSIGEPGTQMTMRTFHTGGVFSSVFNETIQSKVTGVISYSTTGLGVVRRNLHGKNVFQLQNPLTIKIFDWKNTFQEIYLPSGCFLFKKENEFVKIGTKIAEIPISLQSQGSKQFKALLSPQDGELYFSDVQIKVRQTSTSSLFFNRNNGPIWLLLGRTILLPKESKVVLRNHLLDCRKMIGQVKMCTLFESDQFKYYPNLNRWSIRYLVFTFVLNLSKVGNSLVSLFGEFSSNFVLVFNLEDLTDYFSYKRQIASKSVPLITELRERRLMRKLSMKDMNCDLTNSNFLLLSTTNMTRFGSFLSLNKDLIFRYNLVVSNKVRYCVVKKDIFTSGNFASKMVFPGEEIFPNFIAKCLIFVKFIPKDVEEIILLIYPVVEYQVIQTSLLFQMSGSISVVPQIIEQKFWTRDLTYYHGSNILLRKLIKIFEKQELLFRYTQALNSSFSSLLKSELILTNDTNLSLQVTEYFSIDGLLARANSFAGVNREFSILPFQYQYTEPYTIMALVTFYPMYTEEVHSIRRSISAYQSLLFVRKTDLYNLHLEDFSYPIGTPLSQFSQVTKNHYLSCSCVVAGQVGNKYFLRKALPIYLTKGAILNIFHTKILQQGENFAILVNYRKQTDDIIQGLPKIEELLELRGKHRYAVLSQFSGINVLVGRKYLPYYYCIFLLTGGNQSYNHERFTQQPKQSLKKHLQVIKKYLNKHPHTSLRRFQILSTRLYTPRFNFIKNLKKLRYLKSHLSTALVNPSLSLYKYVNLGEPISEGTINPKELTRIFYYYFYPRKG